LIETRWIDISSCSGKRCAADSVCDRGVEQVGRLKFTSHTPFDVSPYGIAVSPVRNGLFTKARNDLDHRNGEYGRLTL
jgi:hypothetical protein